MRFSPKQTQPRDAGVLSEVARITRRPLSSRERLGDAIDAWLSVLAPRTALRRQCARAKQHLFRSVFRTGKGERTHADWNPIPTSADAALDDLPDLRTRARDLVETDPHAASLVNVLADNVVGAGIIPQARATTEDTGLTDAQVEEWNRACEAAFRLWAEREADATEHGTFYELQRQAYESIVVEGEALAHPVRIAERDSPSRTFRTSIEMIEPERLGVPDRGRGVPLRDVLQRVRHGVEIGARRQPIAYWIADGNPHDPIRYPNVTWQRLRRFRGGQRNVLHAFRRRRADQSRGIPRLVPVLTTFRTLSKYLEAELTAARVAACIAAFVERSGLGDDIPPGFELDPGEPTQLLERLEPGIIEYLDPGEKITPFQPNRPANTFDAFVVRILRAIAAAVGLPYELLVRDFSKTNYSSMRAALLETRRGFRCDQALLTRQFCQPIWELVLEEAYLMGLLPRVRDFERLRPHLLRARWVPPAWGWVDPVKEREASVAAVRGNLSTLADEAATNGADWHDVAIGRARELRRLRELEEAHELEPGALSGEVSAASAPAGPGPRAIERDDETEEPQGESEDGNEDEADEA